MDNDEENEVVLVSVGTQTSSDHSAVTLGSEMDLISFSQWHQKMQKEHDMSSQRGKPKFSLWNWCNRICYPCRRLDGIGYDTKICGRCCKFKTFKWWMTGLVIATVFYFIVLHFMGDRALPGRTVFMLMVMFACAFVVGYLLTTNGLPSTVGQLLIGILFGNIPLDILPDYAEHESVEIITFSEKMVLVLIIIRAGLNLDFLKIKGHVRFILQFSMVVYFAEFLLTLLCGHFILGLPWLWSALLATIMSPVSLSTMVSFAEKTSFYIIVDSILPTLMIASSSIEIIVGFYGYSVCLGFIFAKGTSLYRRWWRVLLTVILEIAGGFIFGILMGCIVGMFPDRRSALAPYYRIIVVGGATVAIVSTFHHLGMTGFGVLSSITMVVLARNIWEELGWHYSNNPVLYFYTTVYGFIQPIAVSLVGFTMKFDELDLPTFGKIFGVIFIALAGRELGYLAVSFDRHLDLTVKQKVFLAVCLVPKGATEALLAAVFDEIILENRKYVDESEYTLEESLGFTKTVFHTIVLSILLATPLATLATTFLAPRYLKAEIEAASTKSSGSVLT